jgi:hypothetical protein
MTAPRKIVVGRADYQWTTNHSLFGRLEIADFDSISDYDGKNPITYAQLTAREHGEIVRVRRLAGIGIEYGELHPRHL